jgi:predicted HTH domain antitoxin
MVKKEYKLKSYRLSDSSLKSIYNVSKENNLNESEALRMILNKGLYEYKLDSAIKKYYENNLDLTAGARLAGISKREFIEELSRKGEGINLSKEDYDYSKKSMEKIFGKVKKKTTQRPK